MLALFIASLWLGEAEAQHATARIDDQNIMTYPFGDPDPVPVLYRDVESYPYFRFDAFTHTAREQSWTVVELENPYIHVTVLPEVGGKVWGAKEKSSGNEFVYWNDVLKFRDIAVRGPWTSGGIEFNFSAYGHSPTVSTPVDYLVRTNEDGSASVVVGATDWTSRTTWRVTLTVPRDKAYLQVDNLWYNPTPLNALWYHWLNAAERAQDDLQFFFPGTHYIGHGGDAHPWPIDDQGRDLSYYRNNDFGGNKSYHVLGRYADFYGGYWHDLEFGFGHWAPYADAPGKKIWIWSHARSGAIWEDLLTDEDGQYVEVQAGWKFNQTHGMTSTPFTQTFFPPYVANRWTETFFPVKGTGGIEDASRHGVLNVRRDGRSLEVAVNALEQLDDSLIVKIDGRPVYGEPLVLAPMEVARRTVELPSEYGNVNVVVARAKLQYIGSEELAELERPLRTTRQAEPSSVVSRFRDAEELNRARRYERALHVYLQVLDEEPTHTDALSRAAELYFRRAQYEKSLRYASQALEINTYDPSANFIYGLAQRRIGDLVNAKEALGLAARSPSYRSGAYAEMAAIFLHEDDFNRAAEYAQRSLRSDALNVSAYELLAVSHRMRGLNEKGREVLSELLGIDPLSHFARFEQYLLEPTEESLTSFTSMIRGELPDETYLELAVRYADAGRTAEAIEVLQHAPEDPIVDYWLAYLHRNRSESESRAYLERAISGSPELVFPFRQETLPLLEWAVSREDAWTTKYYLGTLYWSLARKTEAAEWYRGSGDEPDYAPFYLARGFLHQEMKAGGHGDVDRVWADPVHDFEKAAKIDDHQWRARLALIDAYEQRGAPERALRVSTAAYEDFPDNYYIGLKHAATLLRNDNYSEAASVLEETVVLPSEGARTGRALFEHAHLRLAIQAAGAGDYERAMEHLTRSRQWPEHLGVGKPFEPDERLQDYIEAYVSRQMERPDRAHELLKAVAAYTTKHGSRRGVGTYLGASALRELGDEEAAVARLQEWSNTVGSEDLLPRWALASFRGEKPLARELARELDARDVDMSSYSLLRAFMRIRSDL